MNNINDDQILKMDRFRQLHHKFSVLYYFFFKVIYGFVFNFFAVDSGKFGKVAMHLQCTCAIKMKSKTIRKTSDVMYFVA